MKVIGHSTVEMNQHYDHAAEERLGKIRNVIIVKEMIKGTASVNSCI